MNDDDDECPGVTECIRLDFLEWSGNKNPLEADESTVENFIATKYAWTHSDLSSAEVRDAMNAWKTELSKEGLDAVYEAMATGVPPIKGVQ